jgi:hypothetical protein
MTSAPLVSFRLSILLLSRPCPMGASYHCYFYVATGIHYYYASVVLHETSIARHLACFASVRVLCPFRDKETRRGERPSTDQKTQYLRSSILRQPGHVTSHDALSFV